MPKKRSKKRKPGGIKAGMQRRKGLKPGDLPAGMWDVMREALGRKPRVSDLEDINFAAIEEVMRRGTQLRLAQWLHTVMIVLRDHFEFTQEDLARFAQLFRSGMKEIQAHEVAQAQEGAHDQEENSEAPAAD